MSGLHGLVLPMWTKVCPVFMGWCSTCGLLCVGLHGLVLPMRTKVCPVSSRPLHLQAFVVALQLPDSSQHHVPTLSSLRYSHLSATDGFPGPVSTDGWYDCTLLWGVPGALMFPGPVFRCCTSSSTSSLRPNLPDALRQERLKSTRVWQCAMS